MISALEIFKEVLEIQRINSGLMSLETLGCMNLIGSLYLDMLQFDEARKILTDTFFCQTKALGETHPETLETGNRIRLAETMEKYSSELHDLEDKMDNDDDEKVEERARGRPQQAMSTTHTPLHQHARRG